MAPPSTHKISKPEITGIEHSSRLDAVAKRRLQNRLNQRASRERRALKSGKNASHHQKRWIIYTEGAVKPADSSSGQDEQLGPPQPALPSDEIYLRHEKANQHFDINAAYNDRGRNLIANLETRIASAKSGLDYVQLLAPVTNLNIIKAMLNNASILGLSIAALEDEIASHFNIAGPMESDQVLPPSLQPSSSQREIIHHPWIDLMPMRSLRDTLLKNLDQYDEDEFCGDMHGQIGASDGIGMIVWGESWDPTAYEISEALFKKWSWIFKQCPEILMTTNYWRKRRGEKALCSGFPQHRGFVEEDELA